MGSAYWLCVHKNLANHSKARVQSRDFAGAGEAEARNAPLRLDGGRRAHQHLRAPAGDEACSAYDDDFLKFLCRNLFSSNSVCNQYVAHNHKMANLLTFLSEFHLMTASRLARRSVAIVA
eukprot:2434267-Pleurochrysis_carterae.AAC.4